MVQQNILKGSLFAIGAFFCMAVFAIQTKAATTHGSELWVSFLSYLVSAIVIIPFVLPKGLDYLKTEKLRYHLGRAGFGLTASFLYMIAMQYIPIVNATLLFNTTPLFIPIISIFFLHVIVSRNTWFSVLLGFVGVLIIIRPGPSIFTDPGNLIGLAAGISLAVAYLLVKKLSDTEPALRVVFYFLVLATIIQIPFVFIGSPPESPYIWYAMLAGVFYAMAQYLLVKGYSYANASQVGVYQYCSIVFVGLLDWAIYGIVPDLIDLVGIILVVIAGIIIIRERGHN